jgi:hypothetical protein
MISDTERLIYLIYFVSHIPITLCIDVQAIFGSFYPTALQELSKWYVSEYNDFLMLNLPTWFRSFIYCEFLFQLPFFFVASYALYYRKNWVRIPMIIYGAHVSTTVIPLLSEFAFSDQLTQMEALTLGSFYLPYLLVPLGLMFSFALNETPFLDKDKNK